LDLTQFWSKLILSEKAIKTTHRVAYYTVITTTHHVRSRRCTSRRPFKSTFQSEATCLTGQTDMVVW